jgi:hypothetical protein
MFKNRCTSLLIFKKDISFLYKPCKGWWLETTIILRLPLSFLILPSSVVFTESQFVQFFDFSICKPSHFSRNVKNCPSFGFSIPCYGCGSFKYLPQITKLLFRCVVSWFFMEHEKLPQFQLPLIFRSWICLWRSCIQPFTVCDWWSKPVK